MKKICKPGFVWMTICVIMGFSHFTQSQSHYTITQTKESKMTMAGTSTLHDWDMTTQIFTGNAQFGFNPGNDGLNTLQSLTFSLVAQNLKSGQKGLDKNAYKALKTDQFQNIDYKLLSARVSPQKENQFLIKTQGNLTIAGITKQVSMDVYCEINKDSTITCRGSDKLKMSDYKVKPPTFMMGAMKTGDAITLDFTMVYKKEAGI
ncbi:YceI family protein [Rhodocytophaga rosea]|uniref:YceI family protein n=1 Tax=Rhodocytophaga rosea TaxID=2704465 RepID=A0A6C0GBK7_9BACT|nr:YceI family protein [Rhodocytophaga rosea]QHT65321.1 YceI family protein [Rhodocytophaga rosea]